MEEITFSPGDEVYFGGNKIQGIFLGDEGDKELIEKKLVRVIETGMDPEGHHLQWIWVVSRSSLRKDLVK